MGWMKLPRLRYGSLRAWTYEVAIQSLTLFLEFILKNTVQYCSKLNRKNKEKKRCDVAVHVPWIYQWHHQMSWMSLHRNLVWVASNHFPSTQSSALCNRAQKTKSHLYAHCFWLYVRTHTLSVTKSYTYLGHIITDNLCDEPHLILKLK